MPRRIDITLQSVGLAVPERLAAFGQEVANYRAERALKRMAGAVRPYLARLARSRAIHAAAAGRRHGGNRRFPSLSIPTTYEIGGSYLASQTPSARLSAPQTLRWLDFGRRIVPRGTDTGRKTRPRRITDRAMRVSRQAQINAFNRAMAREIEAAAGEEAVGSTKTLRQARNDSIRKARREHRYSRQPPRRPKLTAVQLRFPPVGLGRR